MFLLEIPTKKHREATISASRCRRCSSVADFWVPQRYSREPQRTRVYEYLTSYSTRPQRNFDHWRPLANLLPFVPHLSHLVRVSKIGNTMSKFNEPKRPLDVARDTEGRLVYVFKCGMCGLLFTARRSDKYTCSARCRKDLSRHREEIHGVETIVNRPES